MDFFKKIIPQQLFLLLRPVYHFMTAFSAAVFYGFPSWNLKVIAVTGTKGKTTVVELLHNILQAAGRKTASTSSLRFRIGDKEEINDKKMSMPGRFFIQRFLRQAKKAGCRCAVLEVTSEGIRQYRHRFINFRAAVITNIAPEHLESHGGFEKYLRSKLDIFWRLEETAAAVINRDDAEASRFTAATPAHRVFFGKEGIKYNGDFLQVNDLRITRDDISFRLGEQNIVSSLKGKFNFYNILAASAAAVSLHIDLDKIAEGITRVSGLPGRLEFVQKNPFAAVVDYAHTPDSLREVYRTLRENYPKLVCVLGAAGGGRDKWKRPEFGRIASEFCRKIILTDEDSYDENLEDILEDIVRGIKDGNFEKIPDRREAIRKALAGTTTGEVTIITGKGAEPWIMGPGGSRKKWDDRVVVREELAKIKERHGQ